MLEGSTFERKKKSSEVKTITGRELRDLIYQGSSEPQDKRFLNYKKGGVFKYFNIQNLINIHKKLENLSYPVVKINGVIVAIAELEKSPYEENLYWIAGVSVDPLYQ
jgi:hypothetical protein